MDTTSSTRTDSDVSIRALRGEIAAIRAQLARRRGEVAAIDLARQALVDLPAEDRRLRGSTTGVLATTYLWSGDAAAASRAFAEAVALGQAEDTITLAPLFASGQLVRAQALQGRLHQAAATYQQTLDLAATYGLPAISAIGVAKVGMADVLREWNKLDAAEDLVRQGIAHCVEAGGLAEIALESSLTLARILQARGDSEGALAQIDQAEHFGRQGYVAPSAGRVAAARARLWLTSAAGNIGAAVRWADEREAAWRTDEPPAWDHGAQPVTRGE